MENNLLLIDSTLREGVQAFGFNPSSELKREIARQTYRLGCDIIELGHPIVSECTRNTIQDITTELPSLVGLVHSLLREEEIRLAKEVGAKWIGFFLTIEPGAVRQKYGMQFPHLLRQIEPCIRLAKSLGLKIRFTCEDASRTSINALLAFYQDLTQWNVDMVGFADTTGSLLPSNARTLLREIRSALPTIPLHFHGHNDRGLALANALEALDAGWNSFDASVHGLGERTGIVPLTEAAILLSESFHKNLNLQICTYLETLVSKNLDFEKYGQRRFAHKAGLHCLSALTYPETYESLPIEKLHGKRIGIASKLSGIKSLTVLAQSVGIFLSKQQAEYALSLLKKGDQELWKEEDIKQTLHHLLEFHPFPN